MADNFIDQVHSFLVKKGFKMKMKGSRYYWIRPDATFYADENGDWGFMKSFKLGHVGKTGKGFKSLEMFWKHIQNNYVGEGGQLRIVNKIDNYLSEAKESIVKIMKSAGYERAESQGAGRGNLGRIVRDIYQKDDI
jgi:hypothetical protein